MPLTRWPRLLAATTALLMLVACGSKVVNPVSGKSERSVMDEQSELVEGAKAHQAVLQEYGVVADPKLQAYVNDVGQRLARLSHRKQLKWTFTVLDSPEINAFALPGGYVYITRGIMAYLDSEAELAGVVGHEIGHVTARHGAQRATRQQDAGLGVLAATILGAVLESQGVGGATQMASQASQSYAAGRVASYSRDQETQADQLGAEYLARNGYNPRNMLEVIAVLKRQEQYVTDQARAQGKQVGGGNSWLASHPSNDQRLADIARVAAGYTGTYGDDAQARYYRAIEGMTYGDSRDQGVVRGRNFYHEDLGIALTAPQGWEVRNTPEAIMLVNGAGDAGLIVRLAPANAGSTHEEIIRNVAKPIEGRSERRQVNGLPLTYFTGSRRDSNGQVQGLRLSVVTGPGNRNFLLQYAAKDAAAAQRASAGMAEAEASMRAMSAADRAAARPYALRVTSMPRGGFGELARLAGGTQTEAQLRLLNGVYGGGQDPAPGKPVKIIN